MIAGRTTAPARVALIAFGAIAAGIGLFVLLRAGLPGDRWVRLGVGGDARSLEALRGLLDRNDIPYRVAGPVRSLNRSAVNAGSEAIEVPEGRAAHARWVAAESGIARERDQNLDWLFGEGSFLDTQSRIDQRLLESRKRTVEDAIRWSRNVRDARIVVQRGPEQIYAGRPSSSDSAAVAVALRPGVESLSIAEAGTIRSLVGGAFNIPLENIQVTDDRLRRYQHLDAAAADLTGEEDRTRKAVISTVETLLGRIYRPAEFVVGVLVDLSQRRSRLLQLTYDREKVVALPTRTIQESGPESGLDPALEPARGPGPGSGGRPLFTGEGGETGAVYAVPAPLRLSGPGSSPVKRETAFENRFSSIEEKVEVPAGELRGLSVNVVLDRAAVRRVLQAEEFTRLTPHRRASEEVGSEGDLVNFTVDGRLGRENLDQAIEAHRRAQLEFLKAQLPMSGARVNVSVVMFPSPQPPAPVPGPGTVAAASPPAFGSTAGEREAASGWAGGQWTGLLVGGLASLGILVVYRRLRRAPPPLEVPPLLEEELVEDVASGRGSGHRSGQEP